MARKGFVNAKSVVRVSKASIKMNPDSASYSGIIDSEASLARSICLTTPVRNVFEGIPDVFVIDLEEIPNGKKRPPKEIIKSKKQIRDFMEKSARSDRVYLRGIPVEKGITLQSWFAMAIRYLEDAYEQYPEDI